MQKVMFSFHAAERMQQRFGVKVNTGVNVDISSTFRATGRSYIHNKTGHTVQQFIPKDLSVRMVLEVDLDNMTVVTAMVQGPVVDAAYRNIMH